MSEFRTIYNQRGTKCPIKSFDPEVNKYALKTFDDGHHELVVVGKTNVDDAIQEARDGADIKKIVERYLQTGDVSVLQQKVPVYGAYKELDLKSVLNSRGALEKAWNELSSDDKSKYASFDDFCLNKFADQSAVAVNVDIVKENVDNEKKQNS